MEGRRRPIGGMVDLIGGGGDIRDQDPGLDHDPEDAPGLVHTEDVRRVAAGQDQTAKVQEVAPDLVPNPKREAATGRIIPSRVPGLNHRYPRPGGAFFNFWRPHSCHVAVCV